MVNLEIILYKLRKIRITASNFRKIYSRRSSTDPANLLNAIMYSENLTTKEIEYGKLNESQARKKYTDKTSIEVETTGLHIHKEYVWLGCSPDDIIEDLEGKGLIEIKCVAAKDYRNSTVSEIADKKKNFYLKEKKITLFENHQYYFQIQGQLEITESYFCDFVVYTAKDLFIQRIYRDKIFWKEKVFRKLEEFFFLVYLPELTFRQIPNYKKIINLLHSNYVKLYS